MKRTLQALALCAALGSADALAQESADDRAQTFQAVEGAVKEDVPGGPLLVTAYGFIWLVVFGYVVRLARLQARSESDVARLERALAANPPANPPANSTTSSTT